MGASTVMNQPLPQGFVIDQGLPNGFVLDSPDGQQTALPEGFILDDNQGSPRSPVMDSIKPEGYYDQSKGYLANVRNPIDLMKNESFVSNVLKIFTGNTTAEYKDRKIGLDPVLQSISSELGEMEQQGKVDTPEYEQLYQTFTNTKQFMDSEPEFDMSALVEGAKNDPGGTLAAFQNALLADPELILTPLGWERAAALTAVKLAKAGKTIQTIGKTTAGATAAATTGAAVIAPISAAAQLEEKGEIDLGQLATETGLGAAGAAAFGGLFQGLKGVFSKTSKTIGKPIEELEGALQKEIESGKSISDAMDNVIDMFGVNEGEASQLRATISKLSESMKDENLPGLLKRQAGNIDHALAVGLAAPIAGGVLGYSPEHPEGALAGAVLATGAVIGGRKVIALGNNAVKAIVKTDDRIRIDNLLDKWEGDIATGQRATWQFRNSINEAIPDKARRENLVHYLEGDKSIKLTPNEKQAANSIRDYFDRLHEFAKDEGVLDSYLHDYVPHMWSQGVKTKAEILNELSGRAHVAIGTKHAKQRIIPTFQAGIDAGLKPKTLDIAEIAKVYGDSINRAVRNKQLVEVLQEATDPEGNALILRADKALPNYVLIAHPSLNKKITIKDGDQITRTKIPVKVHPDIAPSLKFVFESSDPNIATRALLALNFAAKRSLVSMSFFHANALTESLLMAGRLPTAIPKALDMLRNGKAGDTVDIALRAGLKIGTIEDLGPDIFYGALKDIQNIADRTLITKPIKYAAQGVYKANKVIDNIMWDKIATGSKLAVFMKEYEKAILKNLKQHQSNPRKYPLKDKDILARDIAEFTNDAFGGLNWRRIAEGVSNKHGRDFALAVNSPPGRRAMQLLMFAPDWTIANIRILGKALPGMSRSPEQAKLHQAYAARGAFYFATVANGINYMMTGKPLWENKDPTTVDLGDGRRMVFSKQFVEPFHWMTETGKTLINKGGILPKELLTQAMGKKYLNPRYSPPMFKRNDTLTERAIARAKHLGRNLVPIFVQQSFPDGILGGFEPQGLAGFAGHPIYGKKKDKIKGLLD